MKKIVLITFCLFALIGCGKKSSIDNSTQEVSSHEAVSFFGMPLIMDDSTHIMQQILAISEDEEMISVDGPILTIGNVLFKINLLVDGVTLISSTPIDDPKMEQVVKYFDSIYDPMPENGANDVYSWRKKGTDGVYHNVRMRPLHSEEGGTTIMFS